MRQPDVAKAASAGAGGDPRKSDRLGGAIKKVSNLRPTPLQLLARRQPPLVRAFTQVRRR